MGPRSQESNPSRSKLIRAAMELFSEKWYGTVSIAEICRRAGVSNGLFYRYFPDKEAIFRNLLEMVIVQIEANLGKMHGTTGLERLDSWADLIFRYSADNSMPVKVFREGQYRFFEYEKRLKSVYIETFSRASGYAPALSQYLFALGGLRFSAVRSALQGIDIDFPSLLKILDGGMFAGMKIDQERVFSTSITPLPVEMLPQARERLLKEGKALIGRQGFFDTNIHEITKAADLSIGAFYMYFESKESFYGELIHRVGREVRRFITLNLGDGLNPLERELRGLWLFLVYLALDPYCYGIVREAEFVLPAEVKAYYEAFAQGYLRRGYPEGLKEGIDRRTAVEFLLGLAHYLGIEVVFNESPDNAMATISELGDLLSEGLARTVRRPK